MVTHNMIRTKEENRYFTEKKKIRFVTVLDLSKFLKQIKSQRLLFTCALISKLPSNMSTKGKGGIRTSTYLLII